GAAHNRGHLDRVAHARRRAWPEWVGRTRSSIAARERLYVRTVLTLRLRGRRVRPVRRETQNPLADQSLEDCLAYRPIDMPQAAGLCEGQAQPGHLGVLAPIRGTSDSTVVRSG